MKKLKSILCLALLLIVGTFTFVGCGSDKGTGKQTNITLAEAKTIIVNALNIEDNQARTFTTANKGNRDIFVKFGKVEITGSNKATFPPQETDAYMPGTQSSIETIIADKTGGTWNSYVMVCTNYNDGVEAGTIKGYYDGEYVYSDVYGHKSKDEFQNSLSTANSIINQEISLIETMFSDAAFETLYSNEVEKTSLKNGFTLKLDVDFMEYMKIIMSSVGENFEEILQGFTEEQLALLKKSQIDLVLSFNSKEDITKIEFTMTGYGFVDDTPITTNYYFTIKQYDKEITTPDWFDASEYDNISEWQ